MKTSYILLTILFAASAFTQAKPSSNDYGFKIIDESQQHEEGDLTLTDVPDPNSRGWFDLYINPTYIGQPQILLPSIYTAPDHSIRYILNRRSAAGSDNISTEGMICDTDQFLGSDGAQFKVFGYADVPNERWIETRNSQWQTTGNKLTSTDAVRQVLYDAFCTDGQAQNDEELRQRIRKEAGYIIQKDYSK